MLFKLFAGDCLQRAINAETGVVKQPVQTIIGKRDHLIGGALNAVGTIQIQLHTGKTHPVHPFNVFGFAAGGQHPESLALQFKGAFKANSAGTSCY